MLEKLRQFLDEMPILGEVVDDEMEQMEYDATNSEQLRKVREEAQHNVCADLKKEGKCYKVPFFVNYTMVCPTCEEKLTGAYIELNNPVTAKGMYLNHVLLHTFIDHDQLFFNEPNVDISGNVDGTRRVDLNLVALLKVLDGSTVPPEIEREVSGYFAAKS
jgi:hypothetical protein